MSAASVNEARTGFDLDALPGDLPAGERVIWQGQPNWWALAVHGFHLPWLALYFATLLVWYGATAFTSGLPLAVAAVSTLRMIGVATVPLLLVCLYAWGTSRSALYTMTNRRLVMRVGIALPVSFNVPFSKIEAAGLKAASDGSGNITLAIEKDEKLNYLVLWPHARPWRLSKPEPMLRCVQDAAAVAQTLGRALAADAGVAVQPAADAAPAQTRPATALA